MFDLRNRKWWAIRIVMCFFGRPREAQVQEYDEGEERQIWVSFVGTQNDDYEEDDQVRSVNKMASAILSWD